MVLLDSRRRLVLIHARRDSGPRILHQRKRGSPHGFEELTLPKGLDRAGYIGAGMDGDRLVLGYIGRPGSYSFQGRVGRPGVPVPGQGRSSWRGSSGRRNRGTTWLYPLIVPERRGFPSRREQQRISQSLLQPNQLSVCAIWRPGVCHRGGGRRRQSIQAKTWPSPRRSGGRPTAHCLSRPRAGPAKGGTGCSSFGGIPMCAGGRRYSMEARESQRSSRIHTSKGVCGCPAPRETPSACTAAKMMAEDGARSSWKASRISD